MRSPERSRPALLIGALLIALTPLAAGVPTLAQQGAPDRFVVPSDGHPMTVWARVPASPRAVVLLVHGRTWSSRPDFDLQVPGMQRSVMASLAARGIAAYAVDLRGYGDTPRDATGWNTPRRSAADVVNVLNWIGDRHAALPKPALIGWSRGGGVVMLAAQMAASRLSSLTLFAFAYDPDARFIDDPPPARPARARNTRDGAISDFISPKVTPQAVVDAFVQQALRSDPITADLKQDGELNALAPARLSVPTLVIYGDRDPGFIPAEAKKFVARLAAIDKQLLVLPGADHAAQLEDTHEQWVAAVTDFVTKPRPR